MTRLEAQALGFQEVGHYTVANSLLFDLGRNRHLSYGCLGTPNETLWLCEVNPQQPREITEIICLHNYDYDGYLTVERLQQLLSFFQFNSTN